ncbi:MAG: LAGLIDADG family homing endonuclease [Patescibacteria group bacterium]
MIKKGFIRNKYPSFRRSKELAFLIGLVLGDGHIQKFPRTESLTIALNVKYPKLVNYTKKLMQHFFSKTPALARKGNGVKWRIYQKQISERLGISSGDRGKSETGIPYWAWKSEMYLVWILKGLFEAEGSLSVHLPTCTYNFQFANRNPKLLKDVGKALEMLNYHPEYRNIATRLRKRAEVRRFEKLIFFRKFRCIAG